MFPDRMPVTVTFTQNLQRHLALPPLEVEGRTVREVLVRVFEQHPAARSFVLDDQGALRHHMVLFVDGEQVEDREGLTDAVRDGASLYVMQALSGG